MSQHFLIISEINSQFRAPFFGGKILMTFSILNGGKFRCTVVPFLAMIKIDEKLVQIYQLSVLTFIDGSRLDLGWRGSLA